MRVPAYLEAEDRVMTHEYVSIVYWRTEEMFHFGKKNLCRSVFSAANVIYYLLEMPFSLEFAARTRKEFQLARGVNLGLTMEDGNRPLLISI